MKHEQYYQEAVPSRTHVFYVFSRLTKYWPCLVHIGIDGIRES